MPANRLTPFLILTSQHSDFHLEDGNMRILWILGNHTSALTLGALEIPFAIAGSATYPFAPWAGKPCNSSTLRATNFFTEFIFSHNFLFVHLKDLLNNIHNQTNDYKNIISFFLLYVNLKQYIFILP